MKKKAFSPDEPQPKLDYLELAESLVGNDGWEVDIVDAQAATEGGPVMRLTSRLLGIDRALTGLALGTSYRYDAILSLGDTLAMSVATGHRLMPLHCRHVTTMTYPVSPRKLKLHRMTGFARELDLILVHTEAERRATMAAYGLAPERLALVPLQVDHHWYRPSPGRPDRLTVGAAGVEFRDYRTLVGAAHQMPQARFILNPQSPWSRKVPDLGDGPLPPNVEVRLLEVGAIRDFYDELSVIAVPIEPNETAAGMTAVLQGMAMAKAVVCTRTAGLATLVSDGETGLLIEPGDTRGWREALQKLQDDPAMAAALGERARKWVERNASMDSWVAQMRAYLNGVLATRTAPAPAAGPVHPAP
jgi:glycosyltransferase involved in cell wall biosynthesis